MNEQESYVISEMSKEEQEKVEEILLKNRIHYFFNRKERKIEVLAIGRRVEEVIKEIRKIPKAKEQVKFT